MLKFNKLSKLIPFLGVFIFILNAGDVNAQCIPGTLYSVSSNGDDQLRTVNPADGSTLTSIPMTIAGGTVETGTGLATDPVTGKLWAILKVSGLGLTGRALATINPTTGVATLIGDTQESFSGIAFTCNRFTNESTLYGVTGDGSTTPETLFTLSKSNGAPTSVCALGHGDDGEALGYNPRNNALYHASGHDGDFDGSDDGVVFEVINNGGTDPCGVTNIDITGSVLTDEEAQALVWDESKGGFLWKQDHGTGPLFLVTPDGTATLLGQMDHQAKGLAFCGTLKPEPIPTMNQWGLLVFGLLILNLSLVFVQRREMI